MMGKSPSIPLSPLSPLEFNEWSPKGSSPPDLNASVILPPEILDKILENIPTNTRTGESTLISCALVATWWTEPSQRLLFSSVSIQTSNYRRRMDGVVLSRSKARLLERVRWLLLGQCRMQDLSQDHGEYLPAVCNVRGLSLYRARAEYINQAQFHACFSAFRGTITFLSIEWIVMSFDAFVALVDYFPDLRTLVLRNFELEPDKGPVPSLSRPLRGTLCVHSSLSSPSKLLSRFAKLDLEYEVLLIDSSNHFRDPVFLGAALQISPNTVKILKMTDKLQSEWPLPTSSSNPKPYPSLLYSSRG